MSGESFFRVTPDVRRIPGGCDDCDAYVTFDHTLAPIYRLVVHHDDTCPWYRAHTDEGPSSS